MAEYPLPKFHFKVDWAGTQIGFTEVTGLTVETEVIEYRQGASKEYNKTKQPGLQKYGNITLKRGTFEKDNEYYTWWNETKFFEEKGAKFRRDITISLLQETNLVAANAGVVLLHPFLKPFFQSLNLLKEGTFKTLKARRRAAALIHYLATGTTEMAEYDMALPKLLVGLPLQKPLDRHLILTEIERTEAEGLLRAVVSHWKALGNTSPAGLREGFLQRTGKLTHRDDGWLLQIEAKTLDILMDRLPWGLSIIRFGWMPEMLFVEWH